MSNNTKLIITADDYGMHPAIDAGIIEGIDAGVINTVTVMMNFGRSKTALKELVNHLADKKKLDAVKIGIHLNITNGMPLTDPDKIDSICIPHNKPPVRGKTHVFYNFHRLKWRDKSNFFPSHIKLELSNQIRLFIDTIEEIKQEMEVQVFLDHFTSQYNVLSSIKRWANVLAELSVNEEFKSYGEFPDQPIPVRRTMPMMIEFEEHPNIGSVLATLQEETREYLKGQNLSFRCLVYKKKFLKFDNLKKEILDGVFLHNGVRFPHVNFFCFYATNKDFLAKVKTVGKYLSAFAAAARIANNLEPEQPVYIEIIHHLGKAPSKEEMDKVKHLSKTEFSGLDLDYFEKYREIETQMVTSTVYKNKIVDPVGKTRGHYSDLNDPKKNKQDPDLEVLVSS